MTASDPQLQNISQVSRERPASAAAPSLLHRNWRPFFIAVSVALDVLAIGAAGVVSFYLRDGVGTFPALPVRQLAIIIAASAATFIGIGLLSGLYRSAYRRSFSDQYQKAATSYFTSAIAIVVGLLVYMGDEFRPVFVLFFLTQIPLFLVFGRSALYAINPHFQKSGYGWHNTLIVNWEGSGEQIFDRLTMFPELGYNVRAIACPHANGAPCAVDQCAIQREIRQTYPRISGKPVKRLPCYGFQELDAALENESVERMFVPTAKPVTDGFADIVQACVRNKVKLKVISPESEELLRFSHVDDIAGISLYSPPKRRTTRSKAIVKRGFDLVVASALIAFLSPLFALVALAILLEDGRPVFFRQWRSSMKGGKGFTMLKFRSMSKDAEDQRASLGRSNQAEPGLFLLMRDPRITRVGKLIRKLSIDELPQLFHVVRGQMSLVGPRPLAKSDLDNINPDNAYAGYYYLRNKSKPGMTGLWQICGRREVPFREMVLLDLYYIENQSILFDLEILFATVPVVLFGKGAY